MSVALYYDPAFLEHDTLTHPESPQRVASAFQLIESSVRENVHRAELAGYHPRLADAVNASLNQTLARSLNTSITVILTLIALILLGGETIREFLIIMLIGLLSGTYSSIFVAAQLLVSWEEGDLPGFRSGAHEEATANA